jgi:hypothetical protein
VRHTAAGIAETFAFAAVFPCRRPCRIVSLVCGVAMHVSV